MRMKKRERSRMRLLRVFGAMVTMCLLLTNIGSHLIFAGSNSLTKGDLIPGSVTISSPKALSGVSLPKNSYGTVTWKDGSAVPSSYESSYGVVFKAGSDCTADFSGVSGWDAASRTVSGTVTVYVTSLAPAKDKAETTPQATPEATPDQEEDSQATPTETPAVTKEPAEDENKPESIGTPVKEGESSFGEDEKENADEDSSLNGSEKDAQTSDVPEAPKYEEEIKEGNVPEKPLDGNQVTDSDSEDTDDTDEDGTEEPAPDTEMPLEEVAEKPEPAEIPESPMELVEAVERPQSVSEDMSPEEQAAAASANHTCQGITVSAEFLPWYVQFRVSDGSGFGFTNAEEANTFQAYEFQLWDLLNDTEYIIPAGESVQVTMPVIAGYEYTIQHILPDGSTETIVPNIYGDTLVFSTSSFSPFGIAGSKPIVGGDIADNSYGNGNSPSVTTAPGSTSSSGSQNTTPTVSPSGNTNSSTSVSSSSASDSRSSSSSSAKAAQTGDNTNVMPYVIIGLGALLVIAALALSFLNKKRNSSSKEEDHDKEK